MAPPSGVHHISNPYFYVRNSRVMKWLSKLLSRGGGAGGGNHHLGEANTVNPHAPSGFRVRHAQGNHNVAGEKNHDALLSPEFLDAPLSPLGFQQVDNLRDHVHTSGLLRRIDLVITSPLLRAMQTAVGVFRGETSGLECPPIIAVEVCRERMGVHPCDKRRSISEHRSLFPQIDFSLIESDDDNLWKADVRETDEEIAARGLKFMNWLKTRHEMEIAVVTHNRFLQHTLSALTTESHPSVRNDICKEFGNCELRSMVLVDKSLSG